MPRTDFNSRNLDTGRPHHTVHSMWRIFTLRDGSVHTTTSAPHATTMSMPHTCAGHPNRHLTQNPTICVYCGSSDHSSTQCCNRHVTLEATRYQEFQCTNSKISGNVGSYRPNNNNSQIPRGVQNHNSDQRRNSSGGSGQHSTRQQQQNHYANNSRSNFRNHGYQPRGPVQSHARFDER